MGKLRTSESTLKRALTVSPQPAQCALAGISAVNQAFNVQAGQKLYLAPADRVRIW